MSAEIIAVGGRALLALLFILAGLTKLIGPKPFLEHMRQEHVPTLLFPAVVALELGAGLCLLVGWRTAIAGWALALFCIATAVVFHRNFADRAERAQFIKDLAIAGGLAFVAARSFQSMF